MELLYNTAYHLRCQLVLDIGRKITLESLDQQMTYGGLLAGTPNSESNDRHVEFALKEATRHCVRGMEESKPHLIPPIRRDYYLGNKVLH